MEILLSIIMGICMSAASGFRLFIPFAVISLSSLLGWINLEEHTLWIGTNTSLIIFGAAAALEIGGYYNPWIDNMLDVISFPLSAFAGILLMSFVIADMNPIFKWILIIIGGGGAAVNVQLITVKARGLSSYFSSGFGNPIVSTIENISSIVISFLAIFSPIPAFVLTLIIIYLVLRIIKKANIKNERPVAEI